MTIVYIIDLLIYIFNIFLFLIEVESQLEAKVQVTKDTEVRYRVNDDTKYFVP